MTPAELALDTNLALVRGFLSRATHVRIEVAGNARNLVQRARACGLLCVVERPAGPGDGAILDISGPLSLFRRTLVYGRALAALVPALAWCPRYRLRALCNLDVDGVPIEIRAGDPIGRAGEPRRFDSKVEERFARDFARAAPDWLVVREPEPISTRAGLFFPDFCLEHRRTQRRFLLEIVGFWTEDYLDKKLTALRHAQLDDLIVCIDAQRDCGPFQGADLGPVVRYRRRIDPADVLAVITP